MKSFSGLPTHYTYNKPKPGALALSKSLAGSQSRSLLTKQALGKAVVFKNSQKV